MISKLKKVAGYRINLHFKVVIKWEYLKELTAYVIMASAKKEIIYKRYTNGPQIVAAIWGPSQF